MSISIFPVCILPLFGIIGLWKRVTKVLKACLNSSDHLQDICEIGTLAFNRGGNGGTLGVEGRLEDGRCDEVRGGGYGRGGDGGDRRWSR